MHFNLVHLVYAFGSYEFLLLFGTIIGSFVNFFDNFWMLHKSLSWKNSQQYGLSGSPKGSKLASFSLNFRPKFSSLRSFFRLVAHPVSWENRKFLLLDSWRLVWCISGQDSSEPIKVGFPGRVRPAGRSHRHEQDAQRRDHQTWRRLEDAALRITPMRRKFCPVIERTNFIKCRLCSFVPKHVENRCRQYFEHSCILIKPSWNNFWTLVRFLGTATLPSSYGTRESIPLFRLKPAMFELWSAEYELHYLTRVLYHGLSPT